MATYNEQLQKVWHEYEKEHGYLPARPRDAVIWGATRGMIDVPDPDPYVSNGAQTGPHIGVEEGPPFRV